MLYLASPFSSPDPLIRRTRFLLAEQVTAQFIEAGEFVYSPIVHCYAMAERYALPGDFEFWRAYNFDMIRRADELRVLTLPGWEASVGVTGELAFAKLAGIAVTYCTQEGKLWLPS